MYAPKVERSECEKDQFYNGMAGEWDLQNPGEVVLGLGDFNKPVGIWIGFEDIHGGYGIGIRNLGKRRQLKFCDEKKMGMANTWFSKKKERQRAFSMGGNKTEIDFVLVGKNNRTYLKDVKAIPWKLQHRLVVTNIDKRKLKKVVKNEQTVRRVWKWKAT